MNPKAYHFLYVVESDRETETKIKIINNLYSMVEKCKCLHKLDKKTMQLALLGAFDDIDVYTCLLKKPFKLQSRLLPVIISRGSVSQVERLISSLKDQEDWPPLFESAKLSLECSFYMPSIFAVLMEEISVENTKEKNKILPFQILLECRMNSFGKIEEYILKMKENNLWDPNNIILKCSLLESSNDQETCTLFEDNGVVADDILDTAYETENIEMQSYIIAYLSDRGQQINLNHLNEGIIKSLSSFPNICSGHMLRRAVEVSDNDVVLQILNTLNNTDPYFIKSEFASDILELSSERLDIYTSLFEKGFIPTIKCLLNVVKNGSFTLFYNTIKSLDDLDKLILTDTFKRELVQESLKRESPRFYRILTEYGIKPHFEDILFASNSKNLPLCRLLVNDIERCILEKCPEGTDVVLSQMFSLYKQMRVKGLKLKPPTLLKLTHLLLKGQISVSKILTLMKDFFSCQIWSFQEDSLSRAYKLSKRNKDLFSILDVYYKSEMEPLLLKALMQRDKEALKENLKQNSGDVKRVLPGVIRKSLITRKQLDNECTQLIYECIENSDCDPSLKILSSVLYSDTENTLQIIFEMSKQTKATLDKDVLQTALEEAIYNKKTGLYCSILKECRVKPTTYCLLYSLRHNNDACFKLTLKNLPEFRKTCKDPYYKTALALCCQNSELNKFKALLEKSKICDTELLFEAVLCKNEHIFKLVKEKLIEQGLWNLKFYEYWIASALIEAEDSPSIKCQFEAYCDDTVNETGIMVCEYPGEEEPYYDEVEDIEDDESDYEVFDSLIRR